MTTFRAGLLTVLLTPLPAAAQDGVFPFDRYQQTLEYLRRELEWSRADVERARRKAVLASADAYRAEDRLAWAAPGGPPGVLGPAASWAAARVRADARMGALAGAESRLRQARQALEQAERHPPFGGR
ncbi:MAG: hypothetical protein U0804_19765 [Gemmataceae bacterium]